MIVDKDELTLAQAFIDAHFERIIDWAVGDIKKCCHMRENGTCNESGALVGAFILWCCTIDYFGGLYTNNSSRGGTKSRFKAFIGKYMKRYDFEQVNDLRWSLLHYYSPHHFVLYHENNLEQNKNIHLTTSNKGIMLHLGWAVKDLADGVNEYWSDLKKDNALKINVWRYYKVQFPIMPIKVEDVVKPTIFTSLSTGTAIQSFNASGTISQDQWLNKQ